MVGDSKIAPSLICMDFLEVGKQINDINRLADLYHFDIIDNHFAPAFGLPLEYLASIKKVATLPIDVHLMAENVENITEQLIRIRVDTITLHVESIVSNAFRVIDKIKNADIKVGIVLNPITPVESIKLLLPLINKVSVLMFDPGIAGQKLVNGTLEKVYNLVQLKKDYSHTYDIEVDGSCNKDNFLKMKKTGANQFVVGTSGLFSLDKDINIAWEKMKDYMTNETIHRQ